jgi:hypothetical protein
MMKNNKSGACIGACTRQMKWKTETNTGVGEPKTMHLLSLRDFREDEDSLLNSSCHSRNQKSMNKQ